jgi:hypothetical protein
LNLKFTGLNQIWVNSKALIGIFSQTAGSTCEFCVNPVNCTFCPRAPSARRRPAASRCLMLAVALNSQSSSPPTLHSHGP